MTELKEVVDRYCGPSKEDLLKVIREAYQEATSGEYVSRSIRAAEVLEKALGESDG